MVLRKAKVEHGVRHNFFLSTLAYFNTSVNRKLYHLQNKGTLAKKLARLLPSASHADRNFAPHRPNCVFHNDFYSNTAIKQLKTQSTLAKDAKLF